MRTFLSSAILAVAFTIAAGGQTPLRLLGSIELPRVEGRIDHLGFDAASQHLFVAALGNNTVEVVDAKGDTHLRSLPGFREPQGIGVASDLKVVGIANGEGEGIQLLSASDYHVEKSVALGDDSDNVRYDIGAHVFYVGYGSGALAAVQPMDGKVIGTVKLPAHPESFQLERSGSRIFVNIPNADQVAVIDRKSMKIVSTWPINEARANFPMALDEANHRLFIGCRRPAKVLIIDTSSGKVTGSFDIVGDTDDLFYDAQRKRVYVSGGDGYLDTFVEQAAGTFNRLGHLQTAGGARTSLFVADQNRLYLAVPHRGSQRAEIRVYEVGS